MPKAARHKIEEGKSLPPPNREFPYTDPAWLSQIPKPVRDRLWSMWVHTQGTDMGLDYRVQEEVLAGKWSKATAPRLMEVALDYIWAWGFIHGGADWAEADTIQACAAIWAIWAAGRGQKAYTDTQIP